MCSLLFRVKKRQGFHTSTLSTKYENSCVSKALLSLVGSIIIGIFVSLSTQGELNWKEKIEKLTFSSIEHKNFTYISFPTKFLLYPDYSNSLMLSYSSNTKSGEVSWTLPSAAERKEESIRRIFNTPRLHRHQGETKKKEFGQHHVFAWVDEAEDLTFFSSVMSERGLHCTVW